MININKNNRELNKLLSNDKLATKVYLYFSTLSYGDDYDPYEGNATDALLNPQTIKAIVTDITSESLAWKQYGQKAQGAKEILCHSRYKEWFKKCSQIKIDTEYYTVFKDAASSRALITNRRFKTIRVIVRQKDND